MPCNRHFPLLLLLLLAGCGGGGADRNDARLDAAASQAALGAGTPELALRLSDTTLAQHPGDLDAMISRGQALTELGRLDEARQSLRKAVAGRPHNVAALLALGRVELPVDPAAAEADFQSALQQQPHNAAALNDLGIARDLQGRHAEAAASYRAAVAADPAMVAAEVNLALCLAMQGHGSDAVHLLRPLAEAADATPKIREDFAAVLAMSGERAEAERILAASLGSADVGKALDALVSAKAAAPVGPVSETAAPAGEALARAPEKPAGTAAVVPVEAAPLSAGPVRAAVPGPAAPVVPATLIGVHATPVMAQSVAGGNATDAPVAAEPHEDASAAAGDQAVVQLAALPTEDAAHTEWDALSRRMPGLLQGRQPLFARTERDGHIFWRVRTAGFSGLAEARGFCVHVRSAGGACTVLISTADAGGQNAVPRKPVPVMAGRPVGSVL